MDPTKTRAIDVVTIEDTDVTLLPGRLYVGSVSGGEFQFWNGSAYEAYLESGSGFQFYSPASGKVRITHPSTYSYRITQ